MTTDTVHKPIDKYIPWMFVAFFLVVAAVDAVFVTVAIDTHTGVVTEQAYEEGLEYNKTLEEAAAQKALGWKGETVYENGILRLTLTDKDARAIEADSVNVSIKRPVTKGYDRDLALEAKGNGVYEAAVDLPLKGQWEVHSFVHAQGHDFQTDAVLMVP